MANKFRLVCLVFQIRVTYCITGKINLIYMKPINCCWIILALFVVIHITENKHFDKHEQWHYGYYGQFQNDPIFSLHGSLEVIYEVGNLGSMKLA